MTKAEKRNERIAKENEKKEKKRKSEMLSEDEVEYTEAASSPVVTKHT